VDKQDREKGWGFKGLNQDISLLEVDLLYVWGSQGETRIVLDCPFADSHHHTNSGHMLY
jgi:hypothetical protein